MPMTWPPRQLSLTRIIVALLFLEHGSMKLLHFPASSGMPEPLPTLIATAGAIELVGGVLLTLGLFTRVAAFICAGEMAVAYFRMHLPSSFFPGLNGGEAAILYCFVFLYFSCAGAGPWSVDAWRSTRAAFPVPGLAA